MDYMKGAEVTSRKRDFGIDVLRCLAIILVLSLHSVNQSVPLATGVGSRMGASQILASCVVGIAAMGVAFFFMITGFLLLPRIYDVESLRKFWKRNILPVIVSFEIWNIICTAVQALRQGAVSKSLLISWSKSALLLHSAPINHLWYMQAIIGAYIVLPLFSLLLHTVREKHLEKYLAIVIAVLLFFFVLIPSVQKLYGGGDSIPRSLARIILPIGNQPAVPMFLYLIFGYVVAEYGQELDKRISVPVLSIVVLVSLLAECGSALWFNLRGDPFRHVLFYAPTLVSACSLFYAVHRFFDGHRRVPKWFFNVISSISKASYGIYCIHMPLLLVLKDHRALLPKSQGWLCFVLYFLIAMSVSMLLTWALSRCKPLAKWLLLTK